MSDEERAHLLHLLELAWGVIANASNGFWERESEDWQGAATRWREMYFAELFRLRADQPKADFERCILSARAIGVVVPSVESILLRARKGCVCTQFLPSMVEDLRAALDPTKAPR